MCIEKGKTYTAYGQGRAITPQTFEVEVVWLDGENVHYRREGETAVFQTPLDRFKEIVRVGQ